MTDNHRTDLVYGHLGEPKYVPELKKWEFARVPNNGYRLKQIGSSQITLPGNSKHQDSSNAHTAKSRDKGISLLQASDPFVAPAAFILPPLAQVSEHVNSSTGAFDPFTGDLLAFGKARYEEPHPGVRSIDIAAIAAGPGGENVRLIRVIKERTRSSVSKDDIFYVPKLEGDEGSLWIGPGSPIQQLSFSVSADSYGSFLAVRTLLGIVILRPMIRHTLVPAPSFHKGAQRLFSHPASRLDPNPIITIAIQDVGNIPFVDVTFNPWFDKQLGILDECGHWRIFELDGKRSAKALFVGNVVSYGSREGGDASNDGWGKMFWVTDVNTTVITHRHSLNVYNVKSHKTIATRKAILNDRILDVKRDPRDYSMIYVLTSTKILWMQIQAASDNMAEQQWNIKTLLSCWHYRSFNDPSLRLSVTERVNSTLIFIWSQLATLITISTLGRSSHSGIQQSVLDTCELVTDLSSVRAAQEHTLQNVGFRAMHLHLIGTAPDRVAEPFSFQSSVNLFRLFTLHHRFSISEGLYQHLPIQKETIQLTDGARKRHANLKSLTKVQDSFLVPDALCSEDEGSINEYEQRKSPDVSSLKPETETSEDPFTLSNEWLARSVNNNVAGRRVVMANKAFDSRRRLVEKLRTFVAERDGVLDYGIELLSDCFGGHFVVSDLDATSDILHQFLREANTYSVYKNPPEGLETLSLKSFSLDVPSLVSVTLHNNSHTKSMTLVSIHNGLAKHWITSLPRITPSQTRVNLNRMLRTVALQLYLSLQGIESMVPELEPEPELPMIGMGIELPALAVRSKKPIIPDYSQIVKSRQKAQKTDESVPPDPPSTLPTPTPTSAASSQRSLSLDATVADAAYTRLSTLTNLRFQPALRDTGQRLLSHWQVGTNPSEYNWAAVKESLERADEEAQVDVGPEALKQRRRREKRARRQLESSQRAMASSSQQQPLLLPTVRIPGALVGSDPVTRPHFRVSSPPAQNAMLYTQEEPGRFGGRPEKRKTAKPTRQQGF